jgi:phenylacetate-CoA ligase
MPGKPYMLEPELEGMPREQLKKRQTELLKKTVEKCYANVDMYKEKFRQLGVTPADIKTLDDIKKLPFTNKEDLRLRYPMKGLLAVPEEDIVRVHMTSGTTGKPTLSPFTKNDLQLAYRLFARGLAASGADNRDVFQCLVGYGVFLGGLIVGPAAELIGMKHIPTGAAVSSSRQLELLQDLGTTIMVGTPSFLLHIGEIARQENIDTKQLGVKILFAGAEACSPKTRQKLEEDWGATVYDIGGTCELYHVWHECSEHTGLHVGEDAFIIEILNPKTNEEVAPGESGELVVTTLMKEAMPLLRWRTGDITSIVVDKECPCGRSSRQIDHLSGRADDMIKVKGVVVFPSQIEGIIRSVAELRESEYQLVVSTGKNYVDDLTVRVEIPDSLLSMGEAVGKKIKEEIHSKLLLSVGIELVKADTLPRFTMKAKRVVDNRKKGH